MTEPELLLDRARVAAQNAYAPYSNFNVGAAVLANGKIFVGCNVENASFGLTMCAERNAIFQAVAGGLRRIDAIALSCVDANPNGPAEAQMPCGACRQVMAEFAGDDLPIEIDRLGTFLLGALLPSAFRL